MENRTQNRVQIYELLISSAILLIVCFLFFIFRTSHKNDFQSDETIGRQLLRHTIVLDAGHGGRDSGASEGKILEKDINLSVVKKIAEILSFYDVDVCLTRDSDFMLAEDSSANKKREDLYNRLNITKKCSNPVFVSIHMNKFPDAKYKGLQVFYSSNSLYSEALAIMIQGNNKKYLEQDNERNVKKATSSIYLLDRLQCPAVLVECGFLSNPADFNKLSDEEYQYKIAFVIANSIIEFLEL